MAIKFGRPIETTYASRRRSSEIRRAERLDLTIRPRRNRRDRMGAAPGARACADHRRPDLAAVHRRRRQDARAGRLDAGRRAA